MATNKKRISKKEDNFYIVRVLKLENSSSPRLRSEISQDELSRLQTLLFPQVGLTLEEWNDRFCQIEEIFS